MVIASVLRKALDVFTEVVTQPSFQQQYLSREKRQALQSIKASKQSPASVASIAFAQAVFGKHPYAHSKIGTPETIEAITISDLKRHYQQFFVAKNLTISLVPTHCHQKYDCLNITHNNQDESD
jgi:zinc protease